MINHMPPNAALMVVVAQLLILNDGWMPAMCPVHMEVHVIKVGVRTR